jgi:adenylosuccinate synthase
MPNLAIIGAQWGDEGKGKIVDLVSLHFDYVARYQGGHNAGHTVMIQGKSYILQLIPSGMFRGGKHGVIGNGVVIDPSALLAEIRRMEDAGFKFENHLHISDRAHLILPHHRWREQESEKQLAIGTTMRGIGPAYEDKVARRGYRVADLVRNEFQEKMEKLYEGKSQAAEFLQQVPTYQKEFSKYICHCSALLAQAMREGKKLLFEGAQGTMLDVDHGTYPFVTSSTCAASGIGAGLGVGPGSVHKVLGISKAYVTRVGGGPLPTELTNDLGELIRTRGKEYGAVTGRPRRCGWLDLVALKYAVQINGLDALCITKLDILDALDEIQLCVAYRGPNNEQIHDFPASLDLLAQCAPEYKTFEGWKSNTYAVRKLEDISPKARRYLEFIEEYLQVPIALLSTSPERDDTIFYPAFDALV